MAPWPEQGSEPKAPDRNKTSDNRTLDHSKSKSEPPEDKKSSTGILKDEDQVRKYYCLMTPCSFAIATRSLNFSTIFFFRDQDSYPIVKVILKCYSKGWF